jgi:succinate dehydrogenase/fumarate reductase flavoprotein subunit
MAMQPDVFETEVLVIGGGGAGSRAALEASLAGASVLLAVKGRHNVLGIRGAGATNAALSEGGARGKPTIVRWQGALVRLHVCRPQRQPALALACH